MSIKSVAIKSDRGFTIIELIIATTVFSTVLLLATTGIVTMGKRYFKGITTSKTQEAVRSVQDEIVNSIQVSGKGDVTYYDPATDSLPAYGTDRSNNNYYQARAVCVGDTRYTYVLNSSMSKGAAHTITSKHVLWKDTKQVGGVCKPADLTQVTPTASNSDTSAAGVASQQEMMFRKMRLSDFSITKASATLYKVQIKAMFGDDDVINFSTDVSNVDTSTCKGINDGGDFCADAALTTFVKRRL